MKNVKMLEPVRLSAPAVTPISLNDAKDHLRVDFTDDDDLITALIEAAVAKLDGWRGDLGECMVTQTWRVDFDRFPGARRLSLPFGPVQAATVDYFDSDNAEQTVASANYSLHEDGAGAFLWLDPDQDTWPSTYDRPDAVRITLTAGYASDQSPDDGSGVPQALRQAIKLIVGHFYEHREQVLVGQPAMELPMAVQALIENYRHRRF